jgi:S1-C subfamily serine protease
LLAPPWLLGVLGLLGAALLSGPLAAEEPPARAAPAAPAVPAAPLGPASSAPLQVTAGNPRPGIVRLERGGHRLGWGVVLRSDGRILTALSALGHGNYVRARFADDHVLGVRVVESDRRWDLALLATEGGRWTEGLRASSVDAAAEGVRLRRFAGRGHDLAEVPVSIKGRQILLGRDGATLEEALLLAGSFAEDDLGSPICDEAGDVIALVGQACDPALRQDCRLSPYGVPVSAIKQFLRAAPAQEPLPAAWLGFRGVAGHSGSVRGVRVIEVDAGGPAEQAGLHARAATANGKAGEDAGDLIVAVNDAPVTTPEELRDTVHRIASSGAGPDQALNSQGNAEGHTAEGVRLLVFGTGRFRELSLPLRAPLKIPASP